MPTQETLIIAAQQGDQTAFEQLFADHEKNLRSYFYRLTTSIQDSEDLAQETFLKAFGRIDSFQGRASFKTWLFTIGTNTARNHHRTKQRWPVNTMDLCEDLIRSSPDDRATMFDDPLSAPDKILEVHEHIDHCFTCIMKTLPLEQQIALMLAEFYAFKGREIADILDVTLSVAKHLLHDARTTMRKIFEDQCALISKDGVCHKCSELTGVFNGKAAAQRAIAQNELVVAATDPEKKDLFEIRLTLVSAIDPLDTDSTSFHHKLMQLNRKALRED